MKVSGNSFVFTGCQRLLRKAEAIKFLEMLGCTTRRNAGDGLSDDRSVREVVYAVSGLMQFARMQVDPGGQGHHFPRQTGHDRAGEFDGHDAVVSMRDGGAVRVMAVLMRPLVPRSGPRVFPLRPVAAQNTSYSGTSAKSEGEREGDNGQQPDHQPPVAWHGYRLVSESGHGFIASRQKRTAAARSRRRSASTRHRLKGKMPSGSKVPRQRTHQDDNEHDGSQHHMKPVESRQHVRRWRRRCHRGW